MWYILYAIDKTKNILINALTVAFTIDNEAPYQIDAEDKTVPAYEGSEPLDLTVYAHDAVDGKFEIGPQSIVDATIVIYKEKTRKILGNVITYYEIVSEVGEGKYYYTVDTLTIDSDNYDIINSTTILGIPTPNTAKSELKPIVKSE